MMVQWIGPSGSMIGSRCAFAMVVVPFSFTHRLRSLVGQRTLGLALGYEDLVDHDDASGVVAPAHAGMNPRPLWVRLTARRPTRADRRRTGGSEAGASLAGRARLDRRRTGGSDGSGRGVSSDVPDRRRIIPVERLTEPGESQWEQRLDLTTPFGPTFLGRQVHARQSRATLQSSPDWARVGQGVVAPSSRMPSRVENCSGVAQDGRE
jgi:hypothetical protein